jgi:hypothetical protein
MANLSKKAVKTVKELNEQLMEAEYKLEAQQKAVSKCRYYLAADANSETVLDLRGAMANLKAYKQQADELRARLEQALDRVFEITVQGDEPDTEEKTDEQLDREFAEQHPRLKEVHALMDKAAEVLNDMDMDELENAIVFDIDTEGRYRVGHPCHEELWAEVTQEPDKLMGKEVYSVRLNEDDEMFGDTHHTNQQIECITLQQAAAAIYIFVRLH